MSEVQDRRNVTVYSDLCLRYRVGEMLLCTVIYVLGTGWENVTVYSDMCLRYRLREMLLCTVMCV